MRVVMFTGDLKPSAQKLRRHEIALTDLLDEAREHANRSSHVVLHHQGGTVVLKDTQAGQER